MDSNSANVAVATIALLVSGISSAFAYRSGVNQNRLSASSVVSDWLRDLRAWASEGVDVLSEATYACRRNDPNPTSEDAQCLHRSRHRLSALIDRGRFLLPNEGQDRFGSQKASAYRRLRHPALDALVAAERILGGDLPLHSFPDKKAALIGLRREFVSTIHAIIDPESLNEQIAALLRLTFESRANDQTLGGLLPDSLKVPAGAEGVLAIASRRYELSQVG
jgi:hypothetical protein